MYDLRSEPTPLLSLGEHATLEPSVTNLGSLYRSMPSLQDMNQAQAMLLLYYCCFCKTARVIKMICWHGFHVRGTPSGLVGSQAELSPSWRSGYSLSLRSTKMTVTRHPPCWSCFNVEWVQHRSRSPASSLS